MEMKKCMKCLAALVCCVMMLFGMVACGDDDDKTTETPKTEKDSTPAYVEFTFTANATQDMLDYTDFVMSYGEGADKKTESVTELTWIKTQRKALPATFTFERNVTLKDGKDASSVAKLTYTKTYSYTYVLYNAAGERLDGDNYSFPSNVDVTGEKFVSAVTEGRLARTFSYAFSEKGEKLW
jgi:hypothetical protein